MYEERERAREETPCIKNTHITFILTSHLQQLRGFVCSNAEMVCGPVGGASGLKEPEMTVTRFVAVMFYLLTIDIQQ